MTRKTTQDDHLTAHFRRSEFACRCGCNTNRVSIRIASALETIRLLVGAPIKITSGYRCPAHNAVVGGAHNSQHVLGLAADITAPCGWRALLDAAERVPAIGGIGVNAAGNWIHVDVREPGGARWGYLGGRVVSLVQVLDAATERT